MANFAHTGKKNPGTKLAAAGGGSPVALTDTMTIHGYTMSISELLKRGLVRVASVSGNTTTYEVTQNPDKINQ